MDEKNNQPPDKNKKAIGYLMFEAGLEFAFLIAVPLVAFLFLGKWLDAKFNRHFFVIIGIFVGLTVSCFAIYKRINELKKML